LQTEVASVKKFTEFPRKLPTVKAPKNFDILAKKAMQKQTQMLQQMQKRQQNYFS